MRDEGGSKRRFPIKGMLRKIIAYISGCGNGHLEEIRDPRFRNPLSILNVFEEVMIVEVEVHSSSNLLLPLIIYD